MLTPVLTHDLESVKKIVLEQLKAYRAKVYLFGSQATGKARLYSDIDIAVLPLQPLPVHALSEIREKLEESDIVREVDVLDDVLTVVNAVDHGAKTFQDIATYLHKVERQGRYYRLAAEILGLIRNYQNNSELTDLGRKLAKSTAQKKKEIVRNAVLNAHVFQRMLPFFELHQNGVTRDQIEKFIGEVTQPTTDSMIHRRASTILSWLEKIEILEMHDNIFKIHTSQITATPILQFPDEEPLVPQSSELREYETVKERTIRAGATVKVLRDQAAHDRANATHRSLINLVADRLRSAGSIPRSNRLVDLAALMQSQSFLFEMKSTTKDNTRSQVRDGLSQLYEYRYLQNLSNAKLILVIANPLHRKEIWMQEYLEEDRKIYLVWDGNNQLFASERTKKELSFLW